MKLIELEESYFVSSQITLDAFEKIKKQGFDVVINNRPDNEEEGQLLSIRLAEALSSIDIKYYYNPVSLPSLSKKEIQLQREICERSKKVLAFCRTGTRSSVLWALNSQSSRRMKFLLQELEEKGVDMTRCLPAMTPFIK